jgi:hypothetical protein
VRLLRSLTALLVLAASWTAAPGAALARSTSVLSYPVADVWPTAVRFVRVDRGYTVKEKEEEAGYILFEMPEGTKTYKASLELIRATDDLGRDATRAAISIPDLPRHFEVMLLDKLAAKVREERGSPAPPPPPRKPQEERPPDAGAKKSTPP